MVRFSPTGAGGSHIVVDSAYADSLYKYLQEHSVEVTPPREAISGTVRIYRAADGRLTREEAPLDHAFDAKATKDEIEKLIGEWIKNFQ